MKLALSNIPIGGLVLTNPIFYTIIYFAALQSSFGCIFSWRRVCKSLKACIDSPAFRVQMSANPSLLLPIHWQELCCAFLTDAMAPENTLDRTYVGPQETSPYTIHYEEGEYTVRKLTTDVVGPDLAKERPNSK